jgi:hypothetical protein
MPRSKSLDEIISDIQKIIRVWEANPTFTLGEITLAGLKAELDDLIELRGQTNEARANVARLVNATNEKANALIAVHTRALSGIRGVFGPNSTQYDEAGGTRPSEKKAAKKKKS